MRWHPANKIILLLLALCGLIGGSIFTQAQDNNLLSNPGFEGAFVTAAVGTVAEDWTAWHVPRQDDMANWQNAQPIYVSSVDAAGLGITPRTRAGTSGSNSQIYYSFFETHDGGLYQQVQGLIPGQEYRFSVYVHVWSSTFEDPELSEDPGDVAVRVGIDPNGGTNGLSSSIEYSTPAVFYDTFRQYSVLATAESSTITVFIRSTVGLPVQNTYVYLDDAVLEPSSEQPAETEEPTDEPTETPTEEPVETEDPTSEEPTPTLENLPTDLPTATPPQAQATNTPVTVVANTSVPVSTATPGDALNGFPGRVIHTVQRGDTVSRLATQYNSSIDAIIQANGLNSSALIFVGQALIIPTPSSGLAFPTVTPNSGVIVVTATPLPTTSTTGESIHQVQAGDTLSSISRQYNTTVATLITLNNILNPNRILVGQTLAVPTSSAVTVTATPLPSATPVVISQPGVPTLLPTFTPGGSVVVQPSTTSGTTYVVQAGDNLYRIALRYNVSLLALAEANNITNYNFVFVGQVLQIP